MGGGRTCGSAANIHQPVPTWYDSRKSACMCLDHLAVVCKCLSFNIDNLYFIPCFSLWAHGNYMWGLHTHACGMIATGGRTPAVTRLRRSLFTEHCCVHSYITLHYVASRYITLHLHLHLPLPLHHIALHSLHPKT